jgi:C4-dicarboxylate-specific signal transduction histidine kinase
MRGWRRLWLRKKMEEELEKELRFHMGQRTADLIASTPHSRLQGGRRPRCE